MCYAFATLTSATVFLHPFWPWISGVVIWRLSQAVEVFWEARQLPSEDVDDNDDDDNDNGDNDGNDDNGEDDDDTDDDYDIGNGVSAKRWKYKWYKW